ncbi:uncharacterized protein LOC114274528 [Camellia sinensis]|uniref:uncharacterized protein LOC114274528 n=1 Tax=Camellia sinensis TaxID=4442 RepID=UPI0010362EE0|nr:uncharacterized protein LOC114274528 [Camellia sinensis]
MEETAENIPMSEHRVDQFKTLMFLELEKEMYHHVGIDWWLEEVKLLIQSWWERDSHNVRHMVLVKPAKPLEEDQKTVRNILGLSEAEDWPTHKLSSMDMLIWNCRGAGNARFRRNLWELVRLHKPDMIILMKTKVELNTMGMFFNNLGFTASTHVDPTGRSGGIWLLWNPSQTNVRVHDASSQMITTTISRQDYLDWVLSAVYASSNIRMRDELWNDLTTLAQHTQKPWLVAGDFNDYSSFEDKRSFSTSPSQNLSQSQRRSQKFSDRISSCNLMDLGCVGPRLTWTNNRKRWANTMVRLDRALCNTEWQTLFPEGYVHNLPRTYSDHSPILLHTQGKIKLDTDGSTRRHGGGGGFGGLFWDETGAWISGYYGRLEICTSLEAELWTVYKGLTIILQRGFNQVIIETDAEQVVKLLSDDLGERCPFWGIVEDARIIMRGCDCSIQHIRREANICADAMAKLGEYQPADLLIVNEPLEELRTLLVADIVHLSEESDRM